MTIEPIQTADTASANLCVYYDGACPLCRAEINHYQGLTGADKIDFIDVSQDRPDLPDDLDRTAALKRFHVRDRDGRLVSGAEAFIAVWSQLPSWHWLARIGALPGVLGVLEIGYRLSLIVRPLISKFWLKHGTRS
jgi:predicted DCC family thiol-disulfide oxidoreductase YuxK